MSLRKLFLVFLVATSLIVVGCGSDDTTDSTTTTDTSDFEPASADCGDSSCL